MKVHEKKEIAAKLIGFPLTNPEVDKTSAPTAKPLQIWIAPQNTYYLTSIFTPNSAVRPDLDLQD